MEHVSVTRYFAGDVFAAGSMLSEFPALFPSQVLMSIDGKMMACPVCLFEGLSRECRYQLQKCDDQLQPLCQREQRHISEVNANAVRCTPSVGPILVFGPLGGSLSWLI